MNRKHRSFLASLLLLALFGVFAGCRETPINNNPVPRGRQFVGEINGVVRDGNTGAPLSGVTVRLIGAEGQPGGETVTATTNADGIYVFRNLQAGFYKIAATPPAGYAPTRVQDVELRDDANSTSTGVAVVRVARDIRFFTANASIQARLSIRTPDGRVLPAPVGTPVFIDFTIPGGVNPGNPNDRTRTVGDVQVGTVTASVRTDTTIGGRTVNIIISGLPAVGSLATAGEFPTLVVPNFEVGGVIYGNPATGRAAEVPLRGLRPGVVSLISPDSLIVSPNVGPTRLLATSVAPGGISATAYGTTDSILIVFNKPMQPATVRPNIVRKRTPYSSSGRADCTFWCVHNTTASRDIPRDTLRSKSGICDKAESAFCNGFRA
ncbi:MAG: carboxypeptidase-like regulatory domain-containing protein [Chloroherpetonaceae bacterium]|nr:carboxypeptidase-like regulatory domain-containing protein [Chloroherpetonaceae bacterium]